MASTIAQFNAPDGLTLTLKVYADGSDTIANGAGGDSCTEQTNDKGTYRATVTEALDGTYRYRGTDANDNTIVKGLIDLVDDTNIHEGYDPIASRNHGNWQTTLDNYSATRGFSGTALPAAAADAAGGLPISDAGGLDMDDMATATELAKVPKSDGTTSWNATALAAINAECDTAVTDGALATAAELAKVPKSDGTTSWNATALAAINAECDTAIADAALATGAELTKAVDRSGYCLTILAGVISNADTATEQYDLTIDSVAHRALFAGLDSSGNRSGVTLSKP